MKGLCRIYALILVVPLLVSCTQQHTDNQEEIRRKAADAAAELKKGVKEFQKDAGAAAEGAKEGWNRDKEKPRPTATRHHPSE